MFACSCMLAWARMCPQPISCFCHLLPRSDLQKLLSWRGDARPRPLVCHLICAVSVNYFYLFLFFASFKICLQELLRWRETVTRARARRNNRADLPRKQLVITGYGWSRSCTSYIDNFGQALAINGFFEEWRRWRRWTWREITYWPACWRRAAG